MGKKKFWVALIAALMLISLAAPAMAQEGLPESIEANAVRIERTHTDNYKKTWSLRKGWHWEETKSTDITNKEKLLGQEIGSPEFTVDAEGKTVTLSLNLNEGWNLDRYILTINGIRYGNLEDIPYSELGKDKQVQFVVKGKASKYNEGEPGEPVLRDWSWLIWQYKHKTVTTISEEWYARFILDFLLNNPNYRRPAGDYYYYGEEGFLPEELVLEPEETAVAPCPFWGLMERAEELANALDEDSGWNLIWGARLAYWDAFHQYLICRDEHFTAEEEAEAAERLEAVREILY